MLGVGLGDAVQEAGADDAAAAPDLRQLAHLQVPVVRAWRPRPSARSPARRRRPSRRTAPCGCRPRATRAARRASGPASTPDASRRWSRSARERAREDRLGDARQRHAQLQRVLRRPAPGALLLGLVDDHVDQRLARLGVDLVQHGRGDLDQEGLQIARVPVVEDALDRRHVEPDAEAQEVVGLRDQLHVGVLDAVVDHLHVVARAVGADVGAARLAVDLRGDRGEDLLDLAVGLARAARHDRRAVQRALLAPGDAGADEAQPLARSAPPRGGACRRSASCPRR